MILLTGEKDKLLDKPCVEAADLFETFKAIPQYEKKIKLDLTGGIIQGPDELEVVAQIVQDSRYLHHLVARHCNLTLEALKTSELCPALIASKSIRKLDVSFNPIGFEGAELLLETVVENRRLTELYLGGINGGDKLAFRMGDFLRTRPLGVVDISENGITEEGWEKVYAAAKV